MPVGQRAVVSHGTRVTRRRQRELENDGVLELDPYDAWAKDDEELYEITVAAQITRVTDALGFSLDKSRRGPPKQETYIWPSQTLVALGGYIDTGQCILCRRSDPPFLPTVTSISM